MAELFLWILGSFLVGMLAGAIALLFMDSRTEGYGDD